MFMERNILLMDTVFTVDWNIKLHIQTDKFPILHFKTKHAFSVFSTIPFLTLKVKKKNCVHKDSSCNVHSSFVSNSHELKVNKVRMNNKKENLFFMTTMTYLSEVKRNKLFTYT